MALVGVGYQGCDIDSFVGGLSVSTVVDVRLTPVSRKPGFSKRALASALGEAGIGYRHLPALGNPKDNRAGFGGGPDELALARQRYGLLLSSAGAQEALAEIVSLASAGEVALLCFEADEQRCHRHVLLELLRERPA